jgi:hypothetical protein
VVRSLAHEQFDDLVKRVRLYAPAAIAAAIAGCPSLGNNGLGNNGLGNNGLGNNGLKHNGLEELILEAVGEPE